MANSNDANNSGDVRRHNPENAATDPNAAAQQNQVKADRAALEEQARRVDASTPANGEAATDPDAAATQDRVRADHDRMQAQAARVEASVPADVRDTPIEAANLGGRRATEDDTQSIRNVDAARDNADAARESARRVQDSVPEGQDRGER
ncbi:MAG: hypothetical protein M3Q69_09125 [Acidobacteriota bacterium]|nr:hypothetical protein [Acidobacteriota bacterium]